MAANQYFQLTIANAFSNLNTIYTEDVAAGNTLASTLEFQIRNTSGENLSFKPLTGDPTEQNHHFKLQFWADTLGDMTTGNTSPGKLNPESSFGFKMSDKPQLNSLGGCIYYFIAEDTNSPWLPNQTITLELSRFLAKPPSGSNWQATKQISLDGQNLLGASSKLIPSSQLSLSSNIVVSTILNNVQLPLHLSLLDLDTLPGTNTPGTGVSVLNNGTASDLILSVVNMALPDDGSLTTNGVLKFDKNSRIAISFDVQGSNETKNWAIGKADDLSPITPSFPSDWTTDKEQEESTGNGRITWTFKPASDQGASLNSLEEMLITIPGIKTMLPSGIANLYFSYQNVPNYGNGAFIVPVQKSPLVTRGQRVGIGTNAPGATLEVKGDMKISGTLDFGSTEREMINLWGGTYGIGIQNKGAYIRTADSFNIYQGPNPNNPGGGKALLSIDSAGKSSIPGALNVGADASINGTLNVDKNLNVTGEMLVKDSLNVFEVFVTDKTTQTMTLNNLSINKNIRITNDVSIGGDGVFELDAPGEPGGRLSVDTEGKVKIPGPLDLGGPFTLNGNLPFEYERFTFIISPDSNSSNSDIYVIPLSGGNEKNMMAWMNTGRKSSDYIGIVAGWRLQNMDINDLFRWTWTVAMGMESPPNTAQDKIWISISAGVDQWNIGTAAIVAIIEAVFIRKSLVNIK